MDPTSKRLDSPLPAVDALDHLRHALLGPGATAAARAQSAADDDFAGFPDSGSGSGPGLGSGSNGDALAIRGPQAAANDAFADFPDSDSVSDSVSGPGLGSGSNGDAPAIGELPYDCFGPADTVEQLQQEVNNWARDRGFAVTRTSGRIRRGPDQECTRYDFLCDRYGPPRPSMGTRPRTTRKCNCKFKALASRSEGG